MKAIHLNNNQTVRLTNGDLITRKDNSLILNHTQELTLTPDMFGQPCWSYFCQKSGTYYNLYAVPYTGNRFEF